jgi:aspartate aminotransferase
VKEAAIRAIRENFSKYTPTPGTMELRKGIVEWHKRELGTSYAPSEVIATAGGKQAIFNLICSMINHGDEVILPVPYWVTFADVINFGGGVKYPLAPRWIARGDVRRFQANDTAPDYWRLYGGITWVLRK